MILYIYELYMNSNEWVYKDITSSFPNSHPFSIARLFDFSITFIREARHAIVGSCLTAASTGDQGSGILIMVHENPYMGVEPEIGWFSPKMDGL